MTYDVLRFILRILQANEVCNLKPYEEKQSKVFSFCLILFFIKQLVFNRKILKKFYFLSFFYDNRKMFCTLDIRRNFGIIIS